MNITKGRPILKATHKPYSTIFVHSHTHNGGLLDPTNRIVPSDQAHDANALLLGGKHDVLVTSLPVPPSYLNYWRDVLRLSCPVIYTIPPESFQNTMLESLLANLEDFVDFLRQQKTQGILRETLVLSVFEAEEKDRQLIVRLQQAGIGKVISECNYDLLPLGTKTNWRSFCSANGVPQLPGGIFRSLRDTLSFVQKELAHGHSVVLKSPHGIGGLGQLRISPNAEGQQNPTSFEFDSTQQSFAELILQNEGEILAERFAKRVECEQVVDLYIDPILLGQSSSVVFDQLTKQPENEKGGIGYYGAKYPSLHFEAKKQTYEYVTKALLPALVKVGYSGPAGIDVMYRPPHPPHFIELNMRTDAITYIKNLADRLGKAHYGKEPGQMAFMTLVNLPHSMNFEELLASQARIFDPSDEGLLVFTNPNRHRWRLFDMASVSPLGIHVAESLMKKGLEKIWGCIKAKKLLQDIQHHPSPLLAHPAGVSKYPYLVSLPQDYNDPWEMERKWPAILFLHGMDERGSDLVKVKQHGIPRTVQEHKDFPFISISPQCPLDDEHWDPLELTKLLDYVAEEFRLDPDRLYLTGCSMGGEGVWLLALELPQRFAAIAPICGDAPEEINVKRVAKIKELPTWVVHGRQDTVVPFEESVKMVKALRSIDAPNVRFTALEDTGHDAWTDTYDNTELYQWFLQQRNKRLLLSTTTFQTL